jgi:alpha-mannosidase
VPPVTVGPGTLSNGLVTVRVASDGTLDIASAGTRLAGVGRIVDGGDIGDSYNYAPPPGDTLIDRPTTVEVAIGRRGPLVGELSVHRTFDWPAGLLGDLSARTVDCVPTPVHLGVELRAGEPFVRVSLEVDNRSVDHRVRFHIPLPGGAQSSFAEGQFGIVERGLEAEGGHGEVPLPTFPAHGFVAAGPVSVLLEHVSEYELVGLESSGGASELAITVIRATGFISRDNHPYRDEPAGPVIAAPTGQAQGPRRVSFAILPNEKGPRDTRIGVAAERFRHPFAVAPASGSGDRRGRAAAGLSLDGDGIVLSSLRNRRVDGDEVYEIRIVREAPRDGVASLRGPFDAVRAVDLLGRAIEDWKRADGRVELDLGGWEIATFQLRPRRA